MTTLKKYSRTALTSLLTIILIVSCIVVLAIIVSIVLLWIFPDRAKSPVISRDIYVVLISSLQRTVIGFLVALVAYHCLYAIQFANSLGSHNETSESNQYELIRLNRFSNTLVLVTSSLLILLPLSLLIIGLTGVDSMYVLLPRAWQYMGMGILGLIVGLVSMRQMRR